MSLAIADILFNASNEGETDVTLVIPTDMMGGEDISQQQPILPHYCKKIRINSKSVAQKQLLQMIHGIVKLYLSLFNQANCQGVILLVYSVILTRGVKNT